MVSLNAALCYVLGQVKGFTRKQFRALYDRQFDYYQLLTGGDDSYLGSFEIPDYLIRQVRLFDMDKVLDQLGRHQETGISIVGFLDESYPEKLKQIYDFPLLLYCKGQPVSWDAPALAVVGTRRCSKYGMAVAREITAEVARHGITIVSGMAAGIDTAAHEAALECGGTTVAVLGGGFDNIYPVSNRGLFGRICETGTVYSEYEPSMESLPHQFPMRNRIVTGLSDGVLVIEGDVRSGAMISAYLALDQGREVFAIPGNITSPVSRGPHKLIREGAKLVESAEDILEEPAFHRQQQLFPAQKESGNRISGHTMNQQLSEVQRRIMEALSALPVGIDILSEQTAVPVTELASELLTLELEGYVIQYPGKLFASQSRL